tara:strand:- start:184 stop:1185 length:1002 start_codon:yes stop_codon:yes gene_type:complete
MDTRERKLQRLLILLPGLFIFYCYVFKCKLPVVYLLASIQIITHIYLLINDKQCTPTTDKTCNFGAMLIGIIFTGIIIKYKLGLIPLIISIYMIISHLFTINIIRGTFIYNDLELPIFDLKSYILMYCDRFHENKLSKFLDKAIANTNGCIIDAGAYIGDSFMTLARKYKDRKFYMIEPSNKNADFIEKIKSDNVKVIRKILGDKKRKYISDNVNAPNSTYIESSTGEESVRVDDIINEPVAIMHYDVEGMELEVVLGSMRLIETYKPIIITESLGIYENKNRQIINKLTKLNYATFVVNENCAAFDIFDKTKCRNYVFIPREYLATLHPQHL